MMKHKLSHEIDHYPEADDAGTVRVTATIFGEDSNLSFTTTALTKYFIDYGNDECKSKEDLNYFLMESGINDDVIFSAMLELIDYVDEITCHASIEYSHALKVRLDLVPEYLDDCNAEIQEAVQVKWFEETVAMLR